MVLAVSISTLNAGIGSSIDIGLKCGIGTSLIFSQPIIQLYLANLQLLDNVTSLVHFDYFSS